MMTIAMIGGDGHYGSIATGVLGAVSVAALVWAIIETRHSRRVTVTASERAERLVQLKSARSEREIKLHESDQASPRVGVYYPVDELDQFSIACVNNSASMIYDVGYFVGVDISGAAIDGHPDDVEPGMTYVHDLDRSRNYAQTPGDYFRWRPRQRGRDWVKWGNGQLSVAPLISVCRWIVSEMRAAIRVRRS